MLGYSLRSCWPHDGHWPRVGHCCLTGCDASPTLDPQLGLSYSCLAAGRAAYRLAGHLAVRCPPPRANILRQRNSPDREAGAQLSRLDRRILRYKPRDCRVAYSVAPSNIRQWLSIGSTGQSFSNLERGELWLAAEPNSPILRSPSALASPRQDHSPLEFSQCAKHGKDKLPVRASGIDHWVRE
jgi:hypothetical protein